MFPQNFVADIQTPLFLINSAYDFWQVSNFTYIVTNSNVHATFFLWFKICAGIVKTILTIFTRLNPEGVEWQ